MKLIDKDALVAEINRLRKKNDTYDKPSHIADVCYKEILSFTDTLEVKEVDLNLIVGWFEHIAQIADDRKTASGVVMEDWAALDEIKAIAKDSIYYIEHHLYEIPVNNQ